MEWQRHAPFPSSLCWRPTASAYYHNRWHPSHIDRWVHWRTQFFPSYTDRRQSGRKSRWFARDTSRHAESVWQSSRDRCRCVALPYACTATPHLGPCNPVAAMTPICPTPLAAPYIRVLWGRRNVSDGMLPPSHEPSDRMVVSMHSNFASLISQ